ncbi:hypothetical protein LWF01_17545 [Saxibacter everestensis]|uniref:AbiTii domain-containing protein n=1 Tax=Saxibacter everestensis TaxID=2909229 RepID=A0ABY8QS88_9MICO|nr:hypothetical protein LWF01_17545 [Brevibacteriaceae bacterium ZFBP1038]
MSNDTSLRMLRNRVLDESETLAGLLRACLMLGSETRSDALREWAALELNGYSNEDALPTYRCIPAGLFADGTSGNTWFKGQRIGTRQLPAEVRDEVPDSVNLRQPIEELEQLANQRDSIKMSMQGFPMLASLWSRELSMYQTVQTIYYQIPRETMAGVVGKARTALVGLVAEIAANVGDDEIPSKGQVDAAVQIIVKGGSSDTYNVDVATNNGVIGQGKHSEQNQSIGVKAAEVVDLLKALRTALPDVADDGDRSDVEQAIDDLQDAITADTPAPEVIKRRAGALKRLAERAGGVALQTATAAATTGAIDLASQFVG